MDRATRLTLGDQVYEIPGLIGIALVSDADGGIGRQRRIWVEGNTRGVEIFTRGDAEHRVFDSHAYVVHPVGELHIGKDGYELDGTATAELYSAKGELLAINIRGSPEASRIELQTTSRDVRLYGQQLVRSHLQELPSDVQAAILTLTCSVLVAPLTIFRKPIANYIRSLKERTSGKPQAYSFG